MSGMRISEAQCPSIAAGFLDYLVSFRVIIASQAFNYRTSLYGATPFFNLHVSIRNKVCYRPSPRFAAHLEHQSSNSNIQSVPPPLPTALRSSFYMRTHHISSYSYCSHPPKDTPHSSIYGGFRRFSLDRVFEFRYSPDYSIYLATDGFVLESSTTTLKLSYSPEGIFFPSVDGSRSSSLSSNFHCLLFDQSNSSIDGDVQFKPASSIFFPTK
ncbi:predicted protein [Sclerotinia sclerotiorum 1980 UF-70]|uniref:Uncharacterized protein n=1 Tax=Sclerotinia sclerotiorum (strain ATCC 18683 / 1980 / Ss-1) TaxID=665079 RepID=A7EUR3_SCLS1|nr:predicted protein [Sclerotinia sclerotiorum 1980 UF-70]EDN93205.1 predicted protein [Sclerotinia sclerotiorum 1980 UF-70]